ncbi:MAG: asparaginase [Planctomycetota bacterium]
MSTIRTVPERLPGEPPPSLGGPEVEALWPENPILVHATRGHAMESVHRGAWCLVSSDGEVLEGRGAFRAPVFVRSAIKCAQALPLLETGAAARFGFDDGDIALAVSSHDAEPCHVERATALLARLGLNEDALQCGPQNPGNDAARFELRVAGARGTRIHNNCSGKHAGFLALAKHLGDDPARYLAEDSLAQRHVRAAVRDMAGIEDFELMTAIDGCSAPTFYLPLVGLAAAFARVTNPAALEPERRAACDRIVQAVRANPVLLAGSSKRLCTDLVRVSGGRLFPKIGAEAVYAVGVPGADVALAVKMDDGGARGLSAVVIALLERYKHLNRAEVDALSSWRTPVLRNWAGLEVGELRVEL